MWVVALTGGIGSGKTAVSDAFASLGVPVIDTDVIARELVLPGQAALAAIVERFGQDCLTADGHLNRHHLRHLVFSDLIAKTDLEAILHPRIQDEVQRRLSSLNAPYCLIVVPLLVETGNTYPANNILVVDVPEPIQLERVIARDGISREQAERILAAQASREQRLQLTDDVISNTGTLNDLQVQVSALHQRYLDLASKYC